MVSLAFVCGALDYGVHVMFSDAFGIEKRRTIPASGAQITDEPSDGGRMTEEMIKRMISARRLARDA